SIGPVSDTCVSATLFRSWGSRARGRAHAVRVGDLRTFRGAPRPRAVATARSTNRHQRDEGGGMSDERLAVGGRGPSPARYFEHVEERRAPLAEAEPVCLYLETTNRCNLLCTTCPRTFEDLEPPADMSWELFTSIVDQFPRIARVVLHGVGEPMMVRG